MNITEIETIAKDVLVSSGRHSLQLILERMTASKVEIDLFVLNYGDEQKEKMLESLRLLINNGSVRRYFMVTEAWMSKDISTVPSKADDREEVLVICEFNRDSNYNKTLFNKFIRIDGKIVFTERNLIEGKEFQGYSRFNFFVEDVMDEVMTKTRIEESFKHITDENVREATKRAREFFKDKNISEDMVRRVVENMIKEGKICISPKVKKWQTV